MTNTFTIQTLMLVLFIVGFSPVNAQIISNFDNSNDGWRVTGDATSSIPQYFATGGNPGGYISTTDETNGGVWYWSAPAKFLGNQISSYGMILQFDLRQSGLNDQFSTNDVILTGSGLTIACDLQNPLTTWTHYNVILDTTLAWRINTINGPLATGNDIKNVLTNLTDLRIRGEYITGVDRGDLDNVILNLPTLPMDLLNFTATIQNEKPLLQWSTTNEVNSSNFELEHGNDGRLFTSIASIKASLNTSSVNQYVFHHDNPFNGTNYYRLKMIDRDGSYKYSSVIKITLNQKTSLQVFPNPTKGSITISGLRATQVNNIQLLDFTGKVLKMERVTANSALINVGQYPAGVYYIRLYTDNQYQLMKFSKQ